ncbi:MAG: tyrosine-type recombinase/integrase [Deltaproteobacteria bacterium]|nr:tyrosine-type recombinase/integrase [Deltaproteobacteria bacterium]
MSTSRSTFRTAEPDLTKLLEAVGIERRHTTHGFRRTFNNLARQVTTGEVVRAMTGHVTEAMTEHYSHVEASEKKAAVESVIAAIEKAGEEKVEGLVEGCAQDAKTAGEGILVTSRNH